MGKYYDDAYAATRAEIDASVEAARLAAEENVRRQNGDAVNADIREKSAMNGGINAGKASTVQKPSANVGEGTLDRDHNAVAMYASAQDDEAAIDAYDARYAGAHDILARDYEVPADDGASVAPAVTASADASAPKTAGSLDELLAEEMARKSELEKQRLAQKQNDPRIRRAENARIMMAGFGDILGGLANVIGTGKGGNNQATSPMIVGVADAVKQDRAGRRKYIDRLRGDIDKADVKIANIKVQKARNETAVQQAEIKAATERYKTDANSAMKNREFDIKENANKAKAENDAAGIKLRGDALAETIRSNKAREANARESNAIRREANEIRRNNNKVSGGGGMKSAVLDYNSMLDEIADRAGYKNWKDVLEQYSAGDETARKIAKQFDLGQDKASESKIKGMIEHYAKSYAPDYYEKHFGEDSGYDEDEDRESPSQKAKDKSNRKPPSRR